ncbi:hypothetical protein RB195_020997 [Necator americanus]|nr:Fcf2 pre-rRNA processing [Necator americanus]ETN80927.1 Fcf2 pre-rRNA processing [Necator americanus]
MLKLKRRPLLSKTELPLPDSSSEDEGDGTSRTALPVVSKDFKIPWRKERSKHDSADFFVLDTVGRTEEPVSESSTSSSENVKPKTDISAPATVMLDERVEKLLDKAVCGPSFEKNYGETASLIGRRAAKRLRKLEREKTMGKEWFDIPATELTEEAKTDLELLQMRAAIDPLAFYRRSDRTVLPKYFQVGRVVDAPEDYYSGRLTKKERKNTMLDELLFDPQFSRSKREKFNAIQKFEKKKRRGTFQHSGPRRKRREKLNDRKKKP